MNCYHTKTFEKLPSDRKKQILMLVTKEFARHGYERSSINSIARKVQISIGAMYSYFESKENLFLSVIANGVELLRMAIGEVDDGESSIYDTLRSLMKVTSKYSRIYSGYVSLYHSLSTHSLNEISRELTAEVERDFIAFYKQLLKRGIEMGEVRPSIDIDFAALYLDNIIVMHELAIANPYHKERLIQYVGAEKSASDEAIIDSMMDMVKRSLSI